MNTQFKHSVDADLSTLKPRRSLETLKTPRSLGWLLTFIVASLIAVASGMVFIPWQQSVTGAGRVIILTPADRPQNIEAQISARIVKWNVQEGQMVKENDQIAEIKDIDSKFLDAEQIERMRGQRRAQTAKLRAANQRAAALSKQIESVNRSREIALPTAQERVLQTDDRLLAAKQSVEAARQTVKTAELNNQRLQELNRLGLRSRRDLELAELEFVRSRTELERQTAALDVAKRDTAIGGFDRQKVDADTSAQISGLEASLASVRETVATIESDILKLDVDLSNTVERQEQTVVRAPRDGQIVRLMKVGAGATVKAGDVLAVLAPTTENKAVELMLSDNDAPLVQIGRPVRLQFAGFPAVQFTGFPGAAIGTFAGRVMVIDPIDDGKNRYRVIVTPDWEAIKAGDEDAWISNTILRPGTETVGWIMLDTVPLGFELWRQFNAFPPTIKEPLGKTNQEKKLDGTIDLEDVLKSK